MAVALALSQVREDFHEGAALHSADGAGGEAELAFAVFIEEAFVDELFEEVGVFGLIGVFHHLLQGFEGLFAVLHDELHHLVEAEELVLGGKFISVEFAVEVLHGGIVAWVGLEVCLNPTSTCGALMEKEDCPLSRVSVTFHTLTR